MAGDLRRVGKREAVKDRIRSWIQEQGLAAGDQILSQNRLATLLHTTAVTVHKALSELEAEGLLRRQKGKGTFVSPPAQPTRPNQVCLVLPDQGLDQPERNPACWPYVQWVFRVFTECLSENGTFSVRSVPPGVVPEDLREFANYSGVFFLGPDSHRKLIQQLVRKQVAPVVVLGRSQRDLPCLSVDENRAEGVRVGIRHLAALGYQRIAMIASEEWWGDVALEGFRRGLQDADLPFDSKRVARVPERFESAADATTAWLKSRVRFDAVIADADPRALHVLDALRAHDLRVPEDVGVMGYDGLAIFGTQPPFLTSVRKPYREMIAAALEELARAPSRMTEHKHIEFIGEVVSGQTCRDLHGQRRGAPGKKRANT